MSATGTTFQEVTVYWNGTAVEGTFSNIDRVLATFPTVQPASWTRPEQRAYGNAVLTTGDPVIGPATISYVIESTYNGVSTGTTIYRELHDEWETLAGIYTPWNAAQELRIDRKDTGGSTLSRVIDCHSLNLGSMRPVVTAEPGVNLFEANKRIRFPVALRAPLGVWHDRTATEQTGTATTGGANIGAFTNGGIMPTPCRVEVTSVGSTPATLTINDQTSDVVAASSTTFTTGSYLDFGYTDPGVLDTSSDITITVGDWMEIATGSNTFTVTTDAGTLGLKILYKERWGSW